MERRNIPWDLIEEILSRVPTKSLARLRSTSKQWNVVLKSWRFAKKHSAYAPKGESLSIMLIDSRVCLVRIINLQGSINVVAPSAKVAYEFNLKDPLSNSDSSQVDIRRVFHCDGLLLCTTKENRLVVWNPCSGETKWIQTRDSCKESEVYTLGYDNSSSCKKYKILRADRRDPVWNGFEIYDFASDSWKVIGSTNFYLQPSHRGVSVKGNTYWIALHGDFLLSFDFSTEKFQSLFLPHHFPFLNEILALSVVRDEQLCLLGTSYTNSRDLLVWVTTSTGPLMTWSKILTFNVSHEVGRYGSMSFLADEQNKALVYCSRHHPDHNKILHIVRGDKYTQVVPHDPNSTITSSSKPLLLNFVPSLAQFQ